MARDGTAGTARWARRFGALLAAGALALAAGCGSGGSGGGTGGGGADAAGAPVDVGLIYSKTGALASYGKAYLAGFTAGLDYATKGTGAVNGHKIQLVERDAAGDPAKATSAATDLIGQGTKILIGPDSSGVAVQLAPIAEQNQVLFISGPAATDAITGANKYTFRSGRQTFQDVQTAASIVGEPAGKKVLVFAQDYEFGQANVKAVTTVLGGAGAQVGQVLAPLSAKDFTPFAQQILAQKPDLLFVAWAGDTTAAMWRALDQQGVFDATKVVTGLADSSSYGAYGSATTKINFLSYYFPQAADNPVNTAMVDKIKAAGGTPDLFSPDGFVAAQMVVHAVEAGTDVAAMTAALDGWKFDAPKGSETVRAGDHAMIQPMYVAKLVAGPNGGFTAQLVNTVPADQVAPPAHG